MPYTILDDRLEDWALLAADGGEAGGVLEVHILPSFCHFSPSVVESRDVRIISPFIYKWFERRGRAISCTSKNTSGIEEVYVLSSFCLVLYSRVQTRELPTLFKILLNDMPKNGGRVEDMKDKVVNIWQLEILLPLWYLSFSSRRAGEYVKRTYSFFSSWRGHCTRSAVYRGIMAEAQDVDILSFSCLLMSSFLT